MKKFMEKLGHRGIIFAASLILSLLAFYYAHTVAELWFYDRRLQSLKASSLDNDVMVVAIDNRSFKELGPWNTWTRSRYAEFIRALGDNKPELIVFDVLFEEDKPEDSDFAKAIRESGIPVVLPYEFTEPDASGYQQEVPLVKPLESEAAAKGFIRSLYDKDGKIRRIELAAKINGKYHPSLDLAAFAKLKGVPMDSIVYEKGRIKVGDSAIPLEEGDVLNVAYYYPINTGAVNRTFPVKSFSGFLGDPKKVPNLKGKVLYIGIGAVGMGDDFPTPVEDRMYGSVIHANVLNTLLRKNFIVRAPLWINILNVLLVVLLFSFLISKLTSAMKIAIASLGTLIVYVAASVILFKAGYWIDFAPVVAAIFFSALSVSVMQFFRTHQLFKQFVTPEVVDRMVSDEDYSALGGVEKVVTVLFADIRGYTSLSEKMNPSEVMEMLNEFHHEMVAIFEQNSGRVVDYMGDAQMVLFGAPIEREDHALCACRAAVESQDALRKLVRKWDVEHLGAFEVGTGICTGKVAVGFVGTEGKKQYTAIGDPTNTASRLQGQSKVLGAPIIISTTTAELVKDQLSIKSLGKVSLKGKSEPMEVFTVSEEKDSPS